jgi:hypothetical protein
MTFWLPETEQVLQSEPQIYRGNYVEFTLETGTLALWCQRLPPTHPGIPVRRCSTL